MSRQFELAGGSIIGRDHRLVPRNNQDAYTIVQGEDVTVAIVADGCGSSPHSEVGAQLGAQLVADAAHVAATQTGGITERLQWIQLDSLAALEAVMERMGDDFRRTVEDYFLFTIVGVVLTPETATFFAFGDGIVVINGAVSCLGPFPGNAPPYLGYGLLYERLDMAVTSGKQFEIIRHMPIGELDNFLIGTDGVLDLINAAEQQLPGMQQPVSGIGQFWQQDKFFSNPELVHRRLKLIGRDWPKRDPEPGLLPDDTTLIVGRRMPAGTDPA